MSKWNSHSDMVHALAKPGSAILQSLTPQKCQVWHMTSCLMGEAGELLEGLDRTHDDLNSDESLNLVEELGDLEFYMEGLRTELNINRQSIVDGCLQLKPSAVDLPTYGIGILIESCNIFDACKKWIIYEKTIDIDVLRLALTRWEWYMAAFRGRRNIQYHDTIEQNMLKLAKRYSSGSYSNQQAQERKDKE